MSEIHEETKRLGIEAKLDLLDKWQAKARCRRTQEKAYRRWNDLEPHLTDKETSVLRAAWAHFTESPFTTDELDEVLFEVRKLWKVQERLRPLSKEEYDAVPSLSQEQLDEVRRKTREDLRKILSRPRLHRRKKYE